jgi:hypothetical protein
MIGLMICREESGIPYGRVRLCARYRRLIARGKTWSSSGIAREIIGFI